MGVTNKETLMTIKFIIYKHRLFSPKKLLTLSNTATAVKSIPCKKKLPNKPYPANEYKSRFQETNPYCRYSTKLHVCTEIKMMTRDIKD